MKSQVLHGLELADLVKRRAIIAVAGDDFLMERLVFKGGNALVLHPRHYGAWLVRS